MLGNGGLKDGRGCGWGWGWVGATAVMYHFADGGLERLRGTSDVYNNIAAGTIAGLAFKSSGTS